MIKHAFCLLALFVTSCTDGANSATPAKPLPAPNMHTNRLANETSPYLLQHKHNPVDWYPWGDEALERARKEDKPIFLSIGYAACHWCHVMEYESFESEEVAEVLNKDFISIKVDREERPDIDEIYMTAVQMMTGAGGWPMTVFMTPDLKPFFGGTYFPKDDKFGRPGFKNLCVELANIWKTRRDEVNETSQKLTNALIQHTSGSAEAGDLPTQKTLDVGIAHLKDAFDDRDGGFGKAPKFPPSWAISMLLRHHQRTDDAMSLTMATKTLDRMAMGGMYDHVGGGFHRYSTDAQWLLPHFEKMLYDNGQLCQVYLEAYQLTGKPYYKRIVTEILAYVEREMLDENGGFYSSEDADSERQEGKYYIWKHEEIASILGDDMERFAEFYSLEEKGNFHSPEHYHAGFNIPHIPDETDPHSLDWTGIDAMRAKLLAVRDKRVHPLLDDKVLSAWNGLMISAFAKSAQVLGEDRYYQRAANAAHFVLDTMRTPQGELLRSHRKGQSKITAYLDDYAAMIGALVDLYETDFDPAWLTVAEKLATILIRDYWDEERGAFYFTVPGQDDLLTRTKPTYDGAIPSGNSMSAVHLPRLGKLLNNADFAERAITILRLNSKALNETPRAYMRMLMGADFFINPPKEIAIVGKPDAADTMALLGAARETYTPSKVVALLDTSADSAAQGNRIPLLAGKGLVEGKAAAYVCKNFACRLPVTTTEALIKMLIEKPTISLE